jgi:hypothetical protein
MKRMILLAGWLIVLVAAACGGGGGGTHDVPIEGEDPIIDTQPDTDAADIPIDEIADPPADEADSPADEIDDGDAADAVEDEEIPNPCPRLPGPADRDRAVVISRPYDTSGGRSSLFEVLTLSASGSLSASGPTFEMGRGTLGEIAFTPDGLVGVAVNDDDGTIGVFTLDASLTPTVVQARFDPGAYASRVVMDPSGERVYVLSSQWADVGGGIYSVALGCDGSPSAEGLVIAAKLPYTLDFLPGAAGRAVVASHDIAGSDPAHDAELLQWAVPPVLVGGADAFGDDEAIVASSDVTPDGLYHLAGDNSLFSSVPNRVAVSRILEGGMEPVQILPSIEDPVAIVISPHGNAGLGASGMGDALVVLGYDPADASTPFSNEGELAITSEPVALPGAAVMIERGSLTGRVLVAELSAVRQVQFGADGSVTDLGTTAFGEGLENIVGLVGVQP